VGYSGALLGYPCRRRIGQSERPQCHWSITRHQRRHRNQRVGDRARSAARRCPVEHRHEPNRPTRCSVSYSRRSRPRGPECYPAIFGWRRPAHSVRLPAPPRSARTGVARAPPNRPSHVIPPRGSVVPCGVSGRVGLSVTLPSGHSALRHLSPPCRHLATDEAVLGTGGSARDRSRARLRWQS
jgi:hypothetical protein